MVTNEQIYNALNSLIQALPERENTTLGDMRRQAAVHLQLPENGLENKKVIVKKFVVAIMNDQPIKLRRDD